MFFGTQTVNSRGHLEIGGCDTVELAERFGTPLYVLDEVLIRQNCQHYLKSFRARYPNTEIAFAGKAFLTTAMCRIADQEGLSLDVVSGGEIHTALKAEFPMERVYFHGNFKSEAEIEMALRQGVGRIVVDSAQELELLDSLAVDTRRKVDILLRLTPGIDPHTHRLVRLGQADTKFGLNIKDGSAMSVVNRALECSRLMLRGIHCHIGSQLLDMDAHAAAVRIMVEFARTILDETGLRVEEINTGGGLGIRYTENQNPPTIDQFAEVVAGTFVSCLNEFQLHKPKLVQEPGRSIVGTAGTTLYRVGTIKTVPIVEDPGHRTYVTVDGGMSDNPRPSLYDAVYTALVANKADAEPSQTVTISGKHCETDTLIQDARMSDIEPGDLLAVVCTGAYHYSMASNYNRLTRPAVVLVADGGADPIVERETFDDLVQHDLIPDRLLRE